jgi:hypothetical protein
MDTDSSSPETSTLIEIQSEVGASEIGDDHVNPITKEDIHV